MRRPELLNPQRFGKTNSRPTQPADIYTLGMVIYEVLTVFYPFYDQQFGTLQLVCRVVDGTRPTKPGNAERIGFGSGTWKLVKECWKTKPTKRPTIRQVLMHLARVSASSTVLDLTRKIPHNRSESSPELNPSSTVLFGFFFFNLR